MLKISTYLIVFLGLLFNNLSAQVITFSPTVTGTGYLPSNNSSGGISFVIRNNNPFPAILNSLTYWNSTTVVRDYTLWYSSTSVSGAPTWPLTVAGGWNPIASITGVTMTGGAQTTIFPILAFNIPANTTYRFFLTSSNVQYTGTGTPPGTMPSGVSPFSFSNSGVDFLVAEAQIAGQNVGWGGGPFSPRAFLGSVTLTLLSAPCTGQPTAGTASALPFNPCPGTNITLSTTGTTAASGLAFQWQRTTSTAPVPPPASWFTIPGATTSPYLYMPPPGSTTRYRCIVTCTFSGLSDTTNITSPAVVVQPWSPTSPCYCNGLVTATTGNDIGQFSIGTYTNPTITPTPQNLNPLANAGITNNMSLTPTIPCFIQGLSYPVSVYQITSTTTLTNCYAKVWIDYNHNASFDDPGEQVWGDTSNAINGFNPTGSFTVPPTSLPGQTRMRVKLQTGGSSIITTPCNNIASGEVEDYLVCINPAGPFDPTITSITAPVFSNCTDSNETLSAVVCNYGSNSINLAINPFYITYNIQTPAGLVQYFDTLNTGTLPAFGASCFTSTVSPVNLYAGGNYAINAVVSCPTLTNNFAGNDSLANAITIFNYRPNAIPYGFCQYGIIPFGQGIGVSGCSAPIFDTVTITFPVSLCNDNVGSTGNGTATGPPANCADIYACQFGSALIPALPPGASFTAPAILRITNLREHPLVPATINTEMRMNIYKGSSPSGPGNILSPGGTVGTILAGGTVTNFTYQRNVTPAQLSNIFSLTPGTPIYLGYWESYQDNISLPDIEINAGGNPTEATLQIFYQYVPPAFSWFDVPTGGTSLYSLSPFNPLSVTNAVVNNSNVPGNYTFYAACLGLPDCRIPVDLIINPTPESCQDSLFACEYAPSAGSSVFDLTTLDNSVRCFNLAPSVDYWRDQNLLVPVTNPLGDTNSTTYLYSRVYYPLTGCFSSDTVYLQSNSIPQFTLPVYAGNACAPACLDISSMISVFPPSNLDSLYYSDPLYTTPHPNPHSICAADTVYCIVKLNDITACSDSAIAYVDVIPATNEIVNQAPANFTICAPIPCGNITLTDGNTETLYTTTDCRKIATVKDSLDGVNLGVTAICEEVVCPAPSHNGQPYITRVYDITPANNGRAIVCLYYLDQDFQDYNGAAFPNWPFMIPNSNLCITKLDGGTLGSPGTTAVSIPNSSITTTYDPLTTVWTVCFPVDSFSTFYCHTCNPGNAALPVQLTSFTGIRAQNAALLNWITAQEINNSHFIVEHSADARQFKPISAPIPSKAVSGNSQGNLSYSYTDEKPNPGTNYYRLKQFDLNGQETYSSTISLYFNQETQISVYPNPVSDELNVAVQSLESQTIWVSIFDAAGRIVRKTEMQLQAGNSVNKVNMEDLSDGTYRIQVSDGKQLKFQQLLLKK